jgi:hypothetical protein
MTSIPLGRSSWRRTSVDEPAILLKNRYFENNPANQSEQMALIARPGLKKYLEVGSGPIREMYSQQGSFGNALFVVSGTEWYKIDQDETITLLKDDLSGDVTGEATSMAGTAQIGSTPAYLYIADGDALYVYNGTTGVVSQVTTPDDVGIVSVGFIAGYIICVVAPLEGYNGRFYWINPGETTIDGLNFATAERAPDTVFSVRVVGDTFWLLGEDTTEVWYPTGDPDAPFQRTPGRAFDHGVWAGTDVQLRDSVMIVDNDGIVYQIVNGAPQRVSDNGVEELIRKAIRTELIG